MSTNLVPLTNRALTQRIKRRLLKNGQRLVIRHAGYYVIDGDSVVESGVDPETLGRSLGLVRPWETVQR